MSHFSGGYAIAIVQNGNVVETRQDGRVAVPFGSDYVIRLINRNGKRAVARVSIDGQQVTGSGIVVNGYGSVDLERPTDKAVTFRFASTESRAAEDHGKAGPDVHGDKGLIQVEWRPEKVYEKHATGYYGAFSEKRLNDSSLRRNTRSGPCGQSLGFDSDESYTPRSMNAALGSMSFGPGRQQPTSGGIKLPDSSRSTPELQSGVTVEGGYSSQSFRTVHFDIDYSVQPTITTIKLMGYMIDDGIPREGTRYCPACRTSTKKSTDRFCRQCGERL